MAYNYKEKNIYSKLGICGCDNSRTVSFCQSKMAGEVALDGTLIYRGTTHRTTNIGGGFGVNIDVPPFRNEGGYNDGLYDNVNRSQGHRVPCVLQLEISGVVNGEYCDDCAEINGTYKGVYSTLSETLLDNTNNGSSEGNPTWFWPLCNNTKRGSSCGADYAYGYLSFDNNDGFNFLTDTVRDVYFYVVIKAQAIDYDPENNSIFQPNKVCYNNENGMSNYGVFAGCAGTPSVTNPLLVVKRIKVGEMKWKLTDSESPQGYYDSSVNALSWNELEITDTVYERVLCTGYTFKITSLTADDFEAYRISVNNRLYFGNANATNGLCYNACEELSQDPDINCESDSYQVEDDATWGIKRIFQTDPYFYKVTISGATGKAEPLNGVHYLINDMFYDSFGADNNKHFLDYDTAPGPDYGDYAKIACTCDGKLEDVCISSIRLISSSYRFLINGGNSTYGSYVIDYRPTSTIDGESFAERNWLDAPITLSYHSTTGVGSILATQHNLEGLTITVEQANLFSDVVQTQCFPKPRSPYCEGGRIPDAFLVEFSDSWEPGFMIAKVPQFTADFAPCFGKNAFNQCTTPYVKEVGDCYICINCLTDCSQRDWQGPVGSFVLTRHKQFVGLEEALNNESCLDTPHECNIPDVKYMYENGDSDKLCQWNSLCLRLYGDTDGVYIELGVHVGVANTEDAHPGPFCLDDYFHPDACPPNIFGPTDSFYDFACTNDTSSDYLGYDNGCVVPNRQCFCGRVTQGGNDPSDPGASAAVGAKFTGQIDTKITEGVKYAVCNDDAGFELTYTENDPFENPVTATGNYVYCTDDPCYNVPNDCGRGSDLPAHLIWNGGTVTVTPIYY